MAERRGRRGRQEGQDVPSRAADYTNLTNPFTPQKAFSDDQVTAIHDNALRVLAELGITVLLDEARAIYRDAGALVDENSQVVRIGPEIVAAALRSAPSEFTLRGATRDKDVHFHPKALVFMPGAGCPNCTDRLRGRRPGTMEDFRELTRIVAGFDVLHMQNTVVEPQDIPVHIRHYATMRHQVLTSTKVPFIYARGVEQDTDGFEMLRLYRGLSAEAFAAEPRTFTVINTNSPRMLDRPMAQGIIDFARAGQLAIVTPFCLMGAMAPVTVAGALSLQHAEALAGIVLSQLVRPGAPVMYGNFASNVDMKSGAPVFGTPEHIRATLGSGQLARHVGLLWRSATGTAANSNDAQAAHETQMGLWAALMGGATLVIHAAGWLEGGLTHGYEKLVTDLEALQVMAELCAPTPGDDAALAFDALAEVAPGGHFFAAAHTMERFHTAFYQPFAFSSANHGQWEAAGAPTMDERATDIWQERLAAHRDPPVDEDGLARMDAFIAQRTAEGGAPPGE